MRRHSATYAATVLVVKIRVIGKYDGEVLVTDEYRSSDDENLDMMLKDFAGWTADRKVKGALTKRGQFADKKLVTVEYELVDDV